MAEKMQKVLSVDKIENYVGKTLGDKSEMRASEFPLANVEDFIKIIYVRLYGQRKNMSYRIECLQETQAGGYRFKDFRIRRKS